MRIAGTPSPNLKRLHRLGVAAVVAGALLTSGCTSSGGATGTAAPAHSTSAASSQQTVGTGGSTSTAPRAAAANPARKPGSKPTGASALTCHDVEQAFIMADVAVSSIEDDTAGTQKAAKNGTLPYAITLHCNVRLPGSRYPQHVQLDRTPGKSTKLVTALGTIGHSTRLPSASGYGDIGYVIPQGNGTYALLAGKGNWILDIGDLRDADDIKHIAHYLLGRL